MPLLLNLRHLEEHGRRLKGKLPVAELDLDVHDEVVQAGEPLNYDFEVEVIESGLLVQGRLWLPLQCQCVRCLKPFEYVLELKKWAQLLPLTGEEKVPVQGDCVDLTPIVREDILLEFPQHPLCETDCRGLPETSNGKVKEPGGSHQTQEKLSAWAALDKLKLKK